MNNQGGSPARIRFVAWNIEKGKRWKLLETCLACEPIQTADVLCLNEVDDGMARSGNRRIAFDIAERLGMQMVFGQAFKEFTKGIGEELLAPGENTTAVQGNATLSRLPILESKNLRLPVCHHPSNRAEKREGGRHALIVRLDCGNGRSLTVVNAHLEVFTTMQCRSRQMKFLLDHLQTGPAIVAGDFNTNTFQRGSVLHTFQSLVYLLRRDVKSRAMAPWSYEPLFRDLRKTGFSWEGFNDSLPTCSVDLSSLEDRVYVPAAIRNRILSRCRTLPLRLDFIACRGLRALSAGRTITDLPCQPSDHLPITCDLWFA
jgi:endonuclease/exonuclease/phosphatase family metal-dependent hydrolase